MGQGVGRVWPRPPAPRVERARPTNPASSTSFDRSGPDKGPSTVQKRFSMMARAVEGAPDCAPLAAPHVAAVACMRSTSLAAALARAIADPPLSAALSLSSAQAPPLLHHCHMLPGTCVARAPACVISGYASQLDSSQVKSSQGHCCVTSALGRPGSPHS